MPQKKNATSNDSVSNIETDSNIDLQKLSQKIKAKRSSKGWDINQLSKVTNIPIATILDYESGNMETLDMNIISNLERVLGKFKIENTSKPKHLNKKRQGKKKAKAEREYLFQSSRQNLGFNAFNN